MSLERAFFHAQLDEIKGLMPLAQKRVVELVREMLEARGYQVNQSSDQ